VKTLLRHLLPVWIALAISVLSGCGGALIPATRTEAERLELARRLTAEGQCTASIEVLKSYIAVNAGSAEVDEAIYLLGACYLRTKDWVAAAAEFERLLRDYPESDSGPSAAFRLGEALYGQARPPAFDQEYTYRALDQWQHYLRTYPGHWLNATAQERMREGRSRIATKLLNTARLYLKLKLAEPARIYFERVARDYADTSLLGEALLGKAQADALAGKRAEAIDQLRRIEAQFAGQPIAERAADERKRLN
jgi:outer membrane protein assembly factor BamD